VLDALREFYETSYTNVHRGVGSSTCWYVVVQLLMLLSQQATPERRLSRAEGR